MGDRDRGGGRPLFDACLEEGSFVLVFILLRWSRMPSARQDYIAGYLSKPLTNKVKSFTGVRCQSI